MTQILGPEITTTSVDFALVRDIVDKVNDLIDQDATGVDGPEVAQG